MDVMTGGAFDDGNFTARIAHSSLPAITSITYEGTYNQHFFFTGEEKENLLSCTYSTLLSRDPISNQVEYYLAVGLNSKYDGPGIKEFKRPPLNLVVCIDVSGSMGIGFNYKETKTKMDVAIESLKILLSQLKPEDSFSLISFDTKASVLIPLSKVETADQTEWTEIISKLTSGGGTNLESAIVQATDIYFKAGLFAGEGGVEGKDLENRVMFLTDMCPNVGTSDGKSLFTITENNAKNNIFTTFIGIGVDFDTNLVEVVSRTRGCNYLSVNSTQEFKITMECDFDYIVTPLAFNAAVTLDSEYFEIERIYGSPGNEKPIGNNLLHVVSLFPSQKLDPNMTKGGIVLVKLKPKKTLADAEDTESTIHCTLQYENRYKKCITLPISTSRFNVNDLGTSGLSSSVRKAVVLTRYVNLMKHWIHDMHGSTSSVHPMSGIPPYLGPLYFSENPKNVIDEHYKKIFLQFITYLTDELEILNDSSLVSHVTQIQQLLDTFK